MLLLYRRCGLETTSERICDRSLSCLCLRLLWLLGRGRAKGIPVSASGRRLRLSWLLLLRRCHVKSTEHTVGILVSLWLLRRLLLDLSGRLLLLVIHKSKCCTRLLLLRGSHVHTTKHVVLLLSLSLLLLLLLWLGGLLTRLHESESTGLRLLRLIRRGWSGKQIKNTCLCRRSLLLLCNLRCLGLLRGGGGRGRL